MGPDMSQQLQWRRTRTLVYVFILYLKEFPCIACIVTKVMRTNLFMGASMMNSTLELPNHC